MSIAIELIPSYSSLNIKTKKDIIYLGRENIQSLIETWMYENKNYIDRIKKLKEQLEELKSINFTEEIKKYDNPILRMGPTDEPMGIEAQCRKRDSTTFNICGWCKYVSSGSYRHNYCISGSCSLRSLLKDENGVSCNTFCCITESSIENIIKSLRNEIKVQKIEQNKILEKINELKNIKERAISKPTFPTFRSYNEFMEGMAVKVYNKNKFYDVKVLYSNAEGYVPCVGDGVEGWFGSCACSIMHIWEYNYLKANPKFAKLWVSTAGRSSSEQYQFLEDLLSKSKFDKINLIR